MKSAGLFPNFVGRHSSMYRGFQIISPLVPGCGRTASRGELRRADGGFRTRGYPRRQEPRTTGDASGCHPTTGRLREKQRELADKKGPKAWLLRHHHERRQPCLKCLMIARRVSETTVECAPMPGVVERETSRNLASYRGASRSQFQIYSYSRVHTLDQESHSHA
jgi:hypothetical protein